MREDRFFYLLFCWYINYFSLGLVSWCKRGAGDGDIRPASTQLSHALCKSCNLGILARLKTHERDGIWCASYLIA